MIIDALVWSKGECLVGKNDLREGMADIRVGYAIAGDDIYIYFGIAG
jgi:hypothetical protein